jgi:predicted lipoprotein with Yx(FWY)xxD motif
MPGGLPQGIVARVRQLDSKEHTMRTNHRTAPALTTWLIAAAAALTALAAAIFLLNPPKTQAAGTVSTVSTATTSLGRILVNSRGHTLYLFGKDKNGKSACAGMCATFWPPLIAAGKPRVAGGAKASLLGTTKRTDGRLQVTYNHHPLYTFVKDKQKGQTNGEGLTAFGGQWNAISPAGAKVVRQAKAKPKPVQSGIPQNNGGDHDSDNNGGPSDGDGNV